MGVPCDATDATEHTWVYDAQKNAITHGGLCLTTNGFNAPMFLTTCGNTTGLNHQDFTYDTKTKQFTGVAPAPSKLYPGCISLAVS
jgi:hypothetical protein